MIRVTGPGEALPRVVVHPVDDALEVEHLPADVPLDREVVGRDRRGQPRDLAREELLVARARRSRCRARSSFLKRRDRARAEREADLEAHVGGDDTLVAQRAEAPVGLDGVVDARPAVEAQLVDVRVDAEDRDLLDVRRRRRARPRRCSMSGCGWSRLMNSYAAQSARGPVSPSGSAKTRSPNSSPPARSASSVEAAGRLPTSSSSLSILLAMSLTPPVRDTKYETDRIRSARTLP